MRVHELQAAREDLLGVIVQSSHVIAVRALADGELRGRQRADIEAIVDVLLRVARLAEDFKDTISEIDINPLIVFDEGRGVKALDALVVKTPGPD